MRLRKRPYRVGEDLKQRSGEADTWNGSPLVIPDRPSALSRRGLVHVGQVQTTPRERMQLNVVYSALRGGSFPARICAERHLLVLFLGYCVWRRGDLLSIPASRLEESSTRSLRGFVNLAVGSLG